MLESRWLLILWLTFDLRPALAGTVDRLVWSEWTAPDVRCHSCFGNCPTLDGCDCDNKTSCFGQFCFVKLEQFTNLGAGAVLKGCVDGLDPAFLGCQYANDELSMACFCQGDLCNTAENLDNYRLTPLPRVDCCDCQPDTDDVDEGRQCSVLTCNRTCSGNYCYADIHSNSQGCGLGHSQIFHFLRTRNYRQVADRLTCAEYYDGHNYMHACTCSGQLCNKAQLYPKQDAASVNKRLENRTSCYSLFVHSDQPITVDVYRTAKTCSSNHCFLSWSSVEVAVGHQATGGQIESLTTGDQPTNPTDRLTLKPFYELSAGCLMVDELDKASKGCTIDWTQSPEQPLSKHCICTGNLCNGYNLISDSIGDSGALMNNIIMDPIAPDFKKHIDRVLTHSTNFGLGDNYVEEGESEPNLDPIDPRSNAYRPIGSGYSIVTIFFCLYNMLRSSI